MFSLKSLLVNLKRTSFKSYTNALSHKKDEIFPAVEDTVSHLHLYLI